MRTLARLTALLACVALLACGSDESKMERGLTVDREEAVPGSAREFDMTEEERRQQEDEEEEKD